MGDVVLQLPVGADEDQLFGRFLNRFMEDRTVEVERVSAMIDAPYLMVRSDPGEACRTVIFQEPNAASAFMSGWALTRRGSAAGIG